MKNRHFTRVDYLIGVSIKYDNNVVICNTANLSLGGMLLKTDNKVPLNTPVNVTVYHANNASIKFSARVVRKEANGVGVQIDNLNADAFSQLRDIVSENSNDPEQVMQETYGMLKFIN